jgi:large subunit ribosomal protein L6
VSRVGKKPIEIPKGVTVSLADDVIKVKGPKGELSRGIPTMVEIKVEGDQVVVHRKAAGRHGRAMHGLARSLINNMVVGVSQGFSRVLEINGVGYRADVKKDVLHLVLGYSHPIELMLPPGVNAKVDKNRIELSGIDKEAVGQIAAVIRDQRPPEPYKGKGIKYVEETIRRKVGKAGVG